MYGCECRIRLSFNYQKTQEVIDMKTVNPFSKHTIFVYGTLMKGQSNHNRFLANATYLGEGELDNYRIFDLGYFPGIVKGDGVVYGELYEVSDSELDDIDRLEGEGSLYLKTPVAVHISGDKTVLSDVYVYNRDVAGCEEVKGKYGVKSKREEEYVWYVAYGSNLLEERMKYYIQGGFCKYNGKTYCACSDPTMPETSRAVMIPYNVMYANYNMGSWKNSAVSFLDLSRPGKAYGRAYKIKKSQLDELHSKEGKGNNWYPECIQLEDMEGLKAYTFGGYTEKRREPFSRVSAEYGYVLYKGMKETYPEMSDDEIYDYLREGI
jgi:gamma-glutamylcyclotransferase (GGCT)/AIG2-like uncharacterized protein YtfP